MIERERRQSRKPFRAKRVGSSLRERAGVRERAQAADVSSLSTKEIEALVHELQVHQVELEIQNEDLRAAQRQLAEARDRFLELYERAPVGYLTLNPEGHVQDANLTAGQLLDMDRDRILGIRFETLIAPAERDDCWKLLRRSMGGDHHAGEFTLARRTGAPLWIKVQAVWNDHPEADGGEWRVILHDITARRRSERALRESEKRFRTLAEVLPVEQERMGRDLHDTVGQELAGIALIAERMVEHVRAGRIPEVEALAELRDGARSALHSVRAVVRGLLPPAIEAGEVFSNALEDMAEAVSNRFKVRCEVESPHSVVVDAPDTAAYLYRIAAEAVTNAAKHARSPHIRVRLAVEEGRLVLEVRDEGVGIPPEIVGEGFGLRIMQHRARMIGAQLEIQRKATGGTLVRCTLPEDRLHSPTWEEDSDGEDGY